MMRKGLTLVELLVVMAIIAILVGLSLNAISRAQKKAREIQCLNNLKQIGLAAFNYRSMHNDFPPAMTRLEPWSENAKIFNCPSATSPWGRYRWTSKQTPWPTLTPLAEDDLPRHDRSRNRLHRDGSVTRGPAEEEGDEE